MQRYRVQAVLGDGSFGIVSSALAENGDLVAIKKMKRKFYNWQECMELREIKSLKKLQHPNIIKLREVVREHDELFLIFEFCENNLFQVQKQTDRPMREDQVRLVMYQVLSGLAYSHKNGFFHRDLKPENLMCNGTEHVKIADFGLAKEIRSRPPFTEYVSTRWYRAPELLLRSPTYNSPIDLWACGAIMGELLLMRPLFPGTSEMDTVFKICSVLGTPSMAAWPDGHRLAANLNVKFPQMTAMPLGSLFPNASQDALHLMQSLLAYDPSRRPTAGDALNHPFFTGRSIGADQRLSTPHSHPSATSLAPGGGGGGGGGGEFGGAPTGRSHQHQRTSSFPDRTTSSTVPPPGGSTSPYLPPLRADSTGPAPSMGSYISQGTGGGRPSGGGGVSGFGSAPPSAAPFSFGVAGSAAVGGAYAGSGGDRGVGAFATSGGGNGGIGGGNPLGSFPGVPYAGSASSSAGGPSAGAASSFQQFYSTPSPPSTTHVPTAQSGTAAWW